MRDYCEECNGFDVVRYYTLRDVETDEFVGNAYLCDECVNIIEDDQWVTCSIE